VHGVSRDKARHLAWLVARHQANHTAFMKHLDEFALDRPLDNLEQVFSKLSARDPHDGSVTDRCTRCTLTVRTPRIEAAKEGTLRRTLPFDPTFPPSTGMPARHRRFQDRSPLNLGSLWKPLPKIAADEA